MTREAGEGVGSQGTRAASRRETATCLVTAFWATAALLPLGFSQTRVSGRASRALLLGALRLRAPVPTAAVPCCRHASPPGRDPPGGPRGPQALPAVAEGPAGKQRPDAEAAQAGIRRLSRGHPHKGLDPKKTKPGVPVAFGRTPKLSSAPPPSRSSGRLSTCSPPAELIKKITGRVGETSRWLEGETRGKSPGPVSPNFPLISFLFLFFIFSKFLHHRSPAASSLVAHTTSFGKSQHLPSRPPARLRSRRGREKFQPVHKPDFSSPRRSHKTGLAARLAWGARGWGGRLARRPEVQCHRGGPVSRAPLPHRGGPGQVKGARPQSPWGRTALKGVARTTLHRGARAQV